MKRIVLPLVLILCLSLLFPATLSEEAEPETFTSGDYEYILLEDGTAKIVRHHGDDSDLKIPDSLGGHPVSTIGDQAFSFHSNLKSVTIPLSVSDIGENPFFYCTYLETISVSRDSPFLAIIDGALFSKADRRLVCYPQFSRKKSYSVPNGVLIIGDTSFALCDLKSVEIPSTVKVIGKNAFFGTSLTEIVVPEGVEIIDDWALSWCERLEKVTLPRSVLYLGKDIFDIDSNFTVYAPIGSRAAAYCAENDLPFEPISSFTIPADENTSVQYEDVPYPDLNELSYQLDWTGITITGYTGDGDILNIPERINGFPVTSIGKSAFSRMNSLKAVYLPSTVTSIGEDSFYYCTSLSTVSLPDHLVSIGAYAFCGCEKLNGLPLPASVRSIGAHAFEACDSLTSIPIPDTFSSTMAALEFYNALPAYTIPDGVTVIEASAFTICRSLRSVTLPDSVTVIEDRAFQYDSSLTTINIPPSVSSIGEYAFAGCTSLVAVVAPGSYAEDYCQAQDISYTYINDWLNTP